MTDKLHHRLCHTHIPLYMWIENLKHNLTCRGGCFLAKIDRERRRTLRLPVPGLVQFRVT